MNKILILVSVALIMVVALALLVIGRWQNEQRMMGDYFGCQQKLSCYGSELEVHVGSSLQDGVWRDECACLNRTSGEFYGI